MSVRKFCPCIGERDVFVSPLSLSILYLYIIIRIFLYFLPSPTPVQSASGGTLAGYLIFSLGSEKHPYLTWPQQQQVILLEHQDYHSVRALLVVASLYFIGLGNITDNISPQINLVIPKICTSKAFFSFL